MVAEGESQHPGVIPRRGAPQGRSRGGLRNNEYDWLEPWARLPSEETGHWGFAHHGLALTRECHILAFHPGEQCILVFGRNGELLRSLPCGALEGHGITTVVEQDEEYVWLADPGVKLKPDPSASLGYGIARDATGRRPSGRALKIRLRDGVVVKELQAPALGTYNSHAFRPTAVAAGTDGSVWVADGYGANLLHHFAADGSLLRTVDGTESGIGFNCPHGVLIDHRRAEPELYVCDRENLRLVVLSMSGDFKRLVAPGLLARPSALAPYGSLLAVAELRGRVSLLDIDDRIIACVGDNQEAADEPGWPNELDADARWVRPTSLLAGRFNSPHGLAADPEGNLYVSEWLIGGRFIKLSPPSR